MTDMDLKLKACAAELARSMFEVSGCPVGDRLTPYMTRSDGAFGAEVFIIACNEFEILRMPVGKGLDIEPTRDFANAVLKMLTASIVYK